MRRDVILRVDGVYRTYNDTGPAVDSDLRVYEVLLLLRGGVDAVHGADLHAVPRLDPYARLTYYVGHGLTSLGLGLYPPAVRLLALEIEIAPAGGQKAMPQVVFNELVAVANRGHVLLGVLKGQDFG